MKRHVSLAAAFSLIFLVSLAEWGDADEPSQPPTVAAADIDSALARGLAALQKAAARYPEHRKCFSCHHQTLPMLAQVTLRGRGIAVDEAQFTAQRDFTLKTFDHRIESMKQGEGIGGRAMTIAYALWATALADVQPGDTTEAMVEYLLKTQRDQGHWIGQTSRPPLEESYLTCTTLAIQGLRKYSTASQRERVDAAIAKAKTWLATAPAKGQEDKVARLWGLHLLDATAAELAAGLAEVLKSQRSDGGWSQLDELDSDAYATGQTLFILQTTGLPTTDSATQRGVAWLLKHQRPDGNWRVESRSKPIQPYYDTDDEDPLGKDQFISVAATSWAVAALGAKTAQ